MRRYLHMLLATLLGVFPLLAEAAPMCSALFGNAVQSHSATGHVELGYKSRLYGSGSSVIAPSVTMTNDYQDQAGYCDGVRCTASGTYATTTSPTFLTNTGRDGSFSLGYQQATSLAAGDYGNLSLGTQAQVTFTTAGSTYRMGSLTTDYQSVLEFQPGDYWINGNFSLDQVTLRRLSGGSGPVRIFVKGNVNIQYNARFTGFGAGQLLIYSTGNVSISSQQLVPAFIYAAGDVTIDYQSGVNGAVSGTVVKVGQESVINYVGPSDLGAACSSEPVQTCLSDDFNRSDGLGDNWAVTSRAGTFGVPRIVADRLRMTDNASYNSTGAALLKLVPGASNKVTVTFRHYAYGGNGADGIVLVFSDATATPQPGGFGGSLGYAQINTTTGFAGGWLGVALDEYGNFSNATENRQGGPGLVRDAVAIRGSGSGTTGYKYLGGTQTLSPGIDKSGSTPAPGYLYRITLDTTTAGKALVTVERDTGAGYTTLISSFDALAASGQAAVPENFYLTFTGSTGGSNNFHEIDDFQVCANKFGAASYPIDHFKLEYSDNALTCTPLPVVIRACTNADNGDGTCIEYNQPVTVTLTPSNFWIGGSTVTFTGHASLSYRSPDAVSKTLGVTDSSVQTRPLSTPVCSTAGCAVSFRDAGFILTVPNMVAGKPVENVVIQGVRKDDTTQACVPAFSNVTRKVKFFGMYQNPATGTQSVNVNGTAVRTVAKSDTAPTDSTTVSLAFDATARALLTVSYGDAGLMTLDAVYAGTDATGDSYLKMTSDNYRYDSASFSPFVSKPYGLCLQTAATCSTADLSCAPFPDVRAGDPFDLTVKAVAWVRDGQPLTADNLCSNPVTPNFALSDIGLASTVVAPADGVNAAMKAVSYDHVLGNATKVPESLADVGIFTLTATPKDRAYLNSETVSGGTSAMIGRMIPAYLDVAGSGTLGAACAGAFSYQGQPMAFEAGQSPLLTVTGKTRQDGVTRNYDRGDFWRLATPPRQDYLSDTGKATLDATGRLTATPADITWQPVTDSDVGNGQRQYRRSGESLAYAPPARPTAEDLPFDAKAKLTLAAAALTDRDGACYLGGGAGCRSFDLPISGSEVRLGRLAIGNAYGSELQALALPWRLESWQGAGNGAFALEPGDTCTLPMLGQPALSDAQGHLSAAETSASRADVTLQQGTVQLTAPGKGNDGSVRVGFAATPTWLYYDWNGAGTPTAATGLATFGVYQGAKPLIFRRELYRSQ